MSIPIWNLFFMITLQLQFQFDLWSNILGRIRLFSMPARTCRSGFHVLWHLHFIWNEDSEFEVSACFLNAVFTSISCLCGLQGWVLLSILCEWKIQRRSEIRRTAIAPRIWSNCEIYLDLWNFCLQILTDFSVFAFRIGALDLGNFSMPNISL